LEDAGSPSATAITPGKTTWMLRPCCVISGRTCQRRTLG
jgi:hypothetical protein